MDTFTSGVSTSSTSVRCALGLGFYTTVWGDLLLLIGLFILSAGFTVLKNVAFGLRMGRELVNELVGCTVLVVYLKYPSINEAMFSGKCYAMGAWVERAPRNPTDLGCCRSSPAAVLNCHGPVDGAYYLMADFGVECHDSLHKLNAAFAFIVLLGVGVGLPATMIYVLRRHEQAHNHKQINFLVGTSPV